MPRKRLQYFDLDAIHRMPAHDAAKVMLETRLPPQLHYWTGADETVGGCLASELNITNPGRTADQSAAVRLKEYGNADFDQDLFDLLEALKKVARKQTLEQSDRVALGSASVTLGHYQQGLRAHIAGAQNELNPPALPEWPEHPPEHLSPEQMLDAAAIHEVFNRKPPTEDETINMVNVQLHWHNVIDMIDDVKQICSHICRERGIQPSQGRNRPGS